jgi:altronate hydrolase
MIGLREILLSRAASPEVAAELDATYRKAEDYCKAVRQYSVSPGNFAGGLTSIEEKSMGAFAKSGSRKIEGVLRVSEPVPHGGLWLLDSVPDDHFMQFGYTNPNDTEGIMDLISVGAQIVMFVTGRGSVIGSPVAPLVKVTGNARTYERMKDDMDFNAGTVLSGERTLDEAALDLMAMVGDVAAGTQSKPEALGHREYFVMYKHQDAPELAAGCRA